MTYDRHQKRSSRTSKIDVECLGERIAPAVYPIFISHYLALKLGSQSQFETLLSEMRQNTENTQQQPRLGIIVGHKMSLGMHFIPTSNTGKLPVKPILNPPNPPVNMPYGAVSLNIVKHPVKPVTNPPNPPVNMPYGAVSLNIVKLPVKPVTNPTNPPVNTPYSLVPLASANAGPRVG